MGLLRPATIETAYAKVGLYGFAGSGKTHTAMLLAHGLAKHPSAKGRPVAMFDTEAGSDYLIPYFERAGIPFMVVKSRSFKDLLEFSREAVAECSVAITDSVTHIWREFTTAYEREKRRRLRFDDWGYLKQEWERFTNVYLKSPMHWILCGRAGYDYEMEETEEDGRTKKELHRTGTKMKTESELAHEPSLLIEMLRIRKSELTKDISDRETIRRAFVVKCRGPAGDVLDGREFDHPTFETFRPFWEQLNLGGQHAGVDTSRTSDAMFESPKTSVSMRLKQVEICLEEIKNAMTEGNIGGTSNDAKKAQVTHLKACFGTAAWSAIETMRLEDLQAGLTKLRAALGLGEDKSPLEQQLEDSLKLAPNLSVVQGGKS
jgi:hypothetical protein